MATVNRVIAIVGGKAHAAACQFEPGPQTRLRLFASTRLGGIGKYRSLLTCLKCGGLDEVWVLTCWIGHPQSKKLANECRKLGIVCRRFNGPGEIRRELKL